MHLHHTQLLGDDEQLVNPAEPATLTDGPDDLVGTTFHVGTRYSRRGGKASIKAPDPRKTTTECTAVFCRYRLPG
ncbi:hypothetical protein ACFOWE_21645 [Planomonospora corallina]|uniref:Uncharacterized protein n=1 Tax=Planomonospora corallina TaxID=1806052 RepID=A0ABV8IBT2_9ACTN